MALRGLAALPFSRPDSDRACANCADSIDPSRYQSQGEDRRSVRADEWPLLSFTLHRSDLEVIVQDPLIIAGKAYHSRLLTGTGKFKDLEETRLATEAAGAQIVTVAIRRSNIGQNPGEPNLLDVLPPDRCALLPNTAGCYTADDAVRTCRLARELLDGHKLVKLEVLGDPRTLFPDVVQTLVAAEILVKDGFDVMVYTSDDPILARRLEEIGCVAVMPLAAPIGSGLGVQNRYNLLEIVENAKVPILVDAGVGTASDAAVAMELGCDGVLMNTAIAGAKLPVLMAGAMRKAVEAGREAFLAGRIPRKRYASASSPVDGLVG
jgi:thiazole synthase